MANSRCAKRVIPRVLFPLFRSVFQKCYRPEPRRAARLLAGVLDVQEARILERLRSDQPFVWLKRRMDPRMTKAVQSLGLPIGKGQPFGLETEGKRFYPQGPLAVHAVGLANIDQHGVEGIERKLDGDLQGDASRYLAVRDGRGGTVLQLVQPASKPPRDVLLTIDLEIQHIVERELDRAWIESGSRAAAAILLDPVTGQVLALANRPTADPNRYGEAPPEGRRNRAVVDQYEPGSTFKVITAATALELGTVTPERPFDCQNGSISIAGKRIRDHHPYGVLTVREILEFPLKMRGVARDERAKAQAALDEARAALERARGEQDAREARLRTFAERHAAGGSS